MMQNQEKDCLSDYTEPRFNGYVGMPAALHLDEYARYLRHAFDSEVYLVGSSLYTKEWNDLDVRVILSDDRFKAMGFGDPETRFRNKKWISLCLAYSCLGEKMIGHTIDFQITQQSYDDIHCKGRREPIGLDLK